MVRDLAFEYPDFLIAVSDSFGIVPQRDFFEERDDHAGEMETSLMMHYHPELVDIERAGDGRSEPFAVESLNDRTAWVPRDWNRVSEDTGIGNPLKRHLRRATPGNRSFLTDSSGIFRSFVNGGRRRARGRRRFAYNR